MTFQYSEIKNEHLQFIITYYSRSGLRSSSGFIQKFISVYVLYPLFLIFYTLVILNFRYKHDTIFDFVEIFSSVSSFANVSIIRFKNTHKNRKVFSCCHEKRLL